MKVELIQWEDSAQSTSTAWKLLSEIQEYDLKPCIIVSTGVVIEENDKYLVIAGHAYSMEDGDVGFCGEICIPKSCVQKRKVINK